MGSCCPDFCPSYAKKGETTNDLYTFLTTEPNRRASMPRAFQLIPPVDRLGRT